MRSVPVPTPASPAGGRAVAEINFTRAHDRALVVFVGALGEADRLMVGALVDRVLADRDCLPDVAYGAERPDREVLDRLCATLSSRRRPKGTTLRQLARALGRQVARAIRDGDRRALGAIYSRLFDLEHLISARLALTLRLVDRVETPGVQDCAPKGTPGLTVPEWGSLFPPGGEVPREVLTRHLLVLGETGSGKTASAILPVVAAMARAPTGRLAGALVIDPKLELGAALERLAPERLHHVRADRAVVNLMSGPRWSLEEDLRAGRWQTAALKILCRVASFVRSSPARVLMDHVPGTDNDEFFAREGTSLATCVLAFILMITSRDVEPRAACPKDDVDAFVLLDELLRRAQGTSHERGPNALALAAWVLDGPLLAPIGDGAISFSVGGTTSSPRSWPFARIAEAWFKHRGEEPGEARDVLRRIVEYWEPMARVRGQYAGVRASASITCQDFAAPAIARTLYFGCEPGFLGESRNGLDFAQLVCARAPGTLVLFQPARDGLNTLVAVSLKALFFEAVLDDADRARSGNDLPVVGNVADEFHRFITSDPLHGEQSFLDTCRSAGAFCVLASQSVASLEHALARGGGSQRQDEASVEILWNNTASKLVFRSTDPKTGNRVDDLCPHRPGLAGVVRVRPVSALQIGEFYAALADGRFERRQLEPFELDDRVRQKPVQKLLPAPIAREEVRHERS